jgi:uncharacterized protein involved in outer membrane biogenesis
MTLLSRLLAAPPRTKLALGGALALLLWLAVFDWNWFRPLLEHHLTQTSKRTVRIGDLHLGLSSHLQPVVRLRDVHVQNAPWADAQPLVVAREASFTFGWLSLLQDVKVVTHLRLVDADVHLARQADGLRNWRLTRPDDRGPARLRVLSIEQVRSRFQVVHKGLGLMFQASSTPLDQAEGEFTQRISFSGTYQAGRFAGEALAGPVLSLQQTGEFFALRGEASSAQTRLRVDGRVADLLKLGGLDALVHISGPSLGQIKPFLPDQPWPATPPYEAEARVTRHGDTLGATALRATLGRSDVAGELSLTQHDDRFAVQATLHSRQLQLVELMRTGPPASPPQRLLPQAELPLALLKRLDATLQWKIDSLQALALPALTGLQLQAKLDPSQLLVALQNTQLAGGQLNGQFVLDHQAASAQVSLQLRASGVRLEQLMPASATVQGPLSGQLQLSGRGPSVADWLGSASGKLSLALPSGSLSPGLDAKLGLNGGKLLRSFFTNDKAVPIRCGALQVDFSRGNGRVRQLVFDTAQTRLDGLGQVQLREESWALLLTPQAHQSAVLALNSSLRVQGSFRSAEVKLVDRQRIEPAQSAGCD